MQEVDWSDLRVFLAVADAGQIGRASGHLGMDPTTLSRRIRRLEKALGATLFERTREGQTLTETGVDLRARVEAMAQAASGIAERPGMEAGLGGLLRISVSEGFGSQFLTEYLPGFSRQHRNLTIELIANSAFLSPSKREADIAVMLSRPKAGPVICRKLSDYRLRLYASPAYLERHGEPAEASALAQGHRFIGYVPDLVYAPELNYLDEFQSGLEPRVRSSSINAQLRLVESGIGIGVLPCFMGDRSALIAPVCKSLSITRSFWIVTHKDTQNLARVKAGKEWLLRCALEGHKRLLPD